MSSLSHLLKGFFFAGFVALSLGLTACGDDTPAGNSCDDVECEFGVCSDGVCTNPSDCLSDNDCIAGYSCGANLTCEPLVTCASEDDCEAGVCADGVCVNPDTCESNDDCLPRTFCGAEGTCRQDPCSVVTCTRGMCERGTGQCISADSCTEASQAVDCIAGEKCADGTCADAETFCDTITCESGVCSFAEGGCANADNCAGDDTNCLTGFFCNDQDQCQVDLCEQNNVDCGAGGICVPTTGQCANADTCTETADCLSGHLCIEGVCQLETVACGDVAGGDGGCPGNQVCEYDEAALTASCVEPATCTTSLDCTGDRQCAGRSCTAPATCRADAFEPNDATDTATVFTDVADNNGLTATLCDGDTDLYSFATSALDNSLLRGQLIVDLDTAANDIGLGQLNVRLLDDAGAEIDSATTGAMGADGTATIAMDMSASTAGDYVVEVTGDSMSAAGATYDLSINIVQTEVVDACDNALPIVINQRLSGVTTDSPATQMGSTCTTADNPAPELVYSLEVDRPMEVSFTVTPLLSSSDFSISLRDECTQPSTETGCTDATGAGEAETLTAVLDPGTHYLVIQAAQDAVGGEFQLFVDAINTFCSPGQAYCADAQTSTYCAVGGGGFVDSACQEGCNPSTGRCNPPPGDRCFDAPATSADTSFDLYLDQLANDYEADAAACGEAPATATDGPDQVFEVTIPANTTMFAQASFTNEVAGSIYVLDTCGDTSTCSQVSTLDDTAGIQSLFRVNDTDADQTLYLVVDTAAGQPFDTGRLDVWFLPAACSEGETRCDPNDASIVQACGPTQTEFVEARTCTSAIWQCSAGACEAESCAGAVDVTAQANQVGGVTFTDNWLNYSDDFGGSGCGVTSTYTPGNDLAFTVSLQPGDVLVASVVSDDIFNDPSITLMPSCGDIDSTTCLAGDSAQDEPAEIAYTASAAETLTILVDNDDTSGGDDNFTIDISILPSCDPATFTASCQAGDVDYCAANGFVSTYSCDVAGCTNAMCNTRASNWCFDAENITADAAATGGTTRSVDFGTLTNDIGFDGACDLTSFETDGTDAVYAVDLVAGQILSVALDPGSSSDDPAVAIVTDCLEAATSCGAGDDTSSGSATASYLAESDGTVWIVADNDDDAGTDTFTLTAEITQSGCPTDTVGGRCLDATTREYCDNTGTVQQQTCDFGCDATNGDCVNPDTCADAINVTSAALTTSGYSATGLWDNYTNDYEGSGCSLSPSLTDGSDLVFAVDLNANQTVTASLGLFNPSSSTWTNDPAVAIVPAASCGDYSACLAGAEQNDAVASTSYTATGTETVYVVIDNDGTSSTESFDLSIMVQ